MAGTEDSSPSRVEHPQTIRKVKSLGESEPFLQFQEQLSRAARVNRPVLLIGERGTGKELAAQSLHLQSPRWQEPFVTLNCAALSPTLIEAELFGHERGAFTGAVGRREGRFELANGGTLFLDEMGLIPREAQEKILRVVEYGTFERVGGSSPIHVDVRILGATNCDLSALAREGVIKQDLLDRLSFEVIFLPPLREREGDIPLLANHFALRMAVEMGRTEVPGFSRSAMKSLETHPWPGNVRELKNVVERAVYRADGAVIENIIFDPFDSPYAPAPAGTAYRDSPDCPDLPLPQAVADLEKAMLHRALEEARYNQRKAAELLGITYHQFRGVYRKYRKD